VVGAMSAMYFQFLLNFTQSTSCINKAKSSQHKSLTDKVPTFSTYWNFWNQLMGEMVPANGTTSH